LPAAILTALRAENKNASLGSASYRAIHRHISLKYGIACGHPDSAPR